MHKIQPWERRPGDFRNPPRRPPMNHQKHVDNYFYTILFLKDYFQPVDNKPPKGKTLYYYITETFEKNSVLEWKNDKLIIYHNLKLPITLEIWDADNQPLIYAPIIQNDVNSLTIGQVLLQDDNTIEIDFSNLPKPVANEKFKLGIKELVDFQFNTPELTDTREYLESITCSPKKGTGLAIVFRRNSLESLYDLIATFDETYFHTMDEGGDIQYLTQRSCYKDIHFTTIYTNNLQDVLDNINTFEYKIEYSWEQYKQYKDEFQQYAEKYGYR